MTTGQSSERGDVGQWLRAVRRARSLSQRELAARANVPLSAITGIEAGRRRPGVALLDQILAATGYRLVVVDVDTDRALAVGDDDPRGRDRGGRRLPAHLERDADPDLTQRSFHHRPRQARGPLREHPWFGQFRGRNACRAPRSQPCANCVGSCRLGEGTDRSVATE